MKKGLMFLVPTLGSAAVFADNGNACCPQPQPCPKTECCEVKCKPVCPQTKVCKTSCYCCRPRPPCECVTRAYDCGVDFFITADFIYWRAREDGLEYALIDPNDSTPVSTAQQGRIVRDNPDYEPGFKVGVGLDFGRSGWDMYFNYTWYRTEHERSNITPGAGQTLTDAYWFVDSDNGGIAPTFASASADWKLWMNILDWEFGRKIFIGDYLMLRPQFGLKAAWNKQQLQLTFNNNQNGGAAAGENPEYIPGHNYASTQQNKFWGIGLRAGLEADWRFTKSFSLLGYFALTGLYEHFKVKRFDEDTSASPMTTDVFCKDNFWQVEPVLEWFVGFKWETWWQCDNYHVALWAGWEVQWWAEQNRFIRMPGSAPHGDGDLSFQGLTAGLMFEF